jgi:hypothetical protein
VRIPILPTIKGKEKEVETPVVETSVVAIQDATIGTIQDGTTMDFLHQEIHLAFLSQAKYA